MMQAVSESRKIKKSKKLNEAIIRANQNAKEDLYNELDRYSLDELILFIAQNGMDAMNGSLESEAASPGFFRTRIKKTFISSYNLDSEYITIAPWHRIRLAYEAVMRLHQNADKTSKSTINKDKYFSLAIKLMKLMGLEDALTAKPYISTKEYGLRYFQFNTTSFHYLNYHLFWESIKRDYYIFSCDRSFNEYVNTIIKEETGLDLDAFIFITFFLAILTSEQSTFTKTELQEQIKWDERIQFDSLLRVMNIYSSRYHEICEAKVKESILQIKPYIQMNEDLYACVDCATVMIMLEHASSWIVRNHELKNRSSEFVNKFGVVFEKYVESLFVKYLGADDYIKIKESNKQKRADWKIQLGDYRLLIEQKSSLLDLDVRSVLGNIENHKKYLKRTVIESIQQLHETEIFYNDGVYIKVILVYEEYFNTDILEYVFDLSLTDIENDGYYWIVTIREFEMLLGLYKRDYKTFCDVMSTKIFLESNHIEDGRTLGLLIAKRGQDINYLKEVEALESVIEDLGKQYLSRDEDDV